MKKIEQFFVTCWIGALGFCIIGIVLALFLLFLYPLKVCFNFGREGGSFFLFLIQKAKSDPHIQ
jgi:hypothetical protein